MVAETAAQIELDFIKLYNPTKFKPRLNNFEEHARVQMNIKPVFVSVETFYFTI